MKIGDVVRHPSDGDIGVVLSIHRDFGGDGYELEINWMKDGYIHRMRYRPLEILTDTNCPGEKDSA